MVKPVSSEYKVHKLYNIMVTAAVGMLASRLACRDLSVFILYLLVLLLRKYPL